MNGKYWGQKGLVTVGGQLARNGLEILSDSGELRILSGYRGLWIFSTTDIWMKILWAYSDLEILSK